MESCLSFSRILEQGPAPQVSELSGISAVSSTVPGTLGLSAVTTFLCTQSWQLQMADGMYNECVTQGSSASLVEPEKYSKCSCCCSQPSGSLSFCFFQGSSPGTGTCGLGGRVGSMGSLAGWEARQARLSRAHLVGCSFHFQCGFLWGTES